MADCKPAQGTLQNYLYCVLQSIILMQMAFKICKLCDIRICIIIAALEV